MSTNYAISAISVTLTLGILQAADAQSMHIVDKYNIIILSLEYIRAKFECSDDIDILSLSLCFMAVSMPFLVL